MGSGKKIIAGLNEAIEHAKANTEQRNDAVCICGEPDCRLWMEHGFSSQPPAPSPLAGEVREAIERSRATAMEYAVKARIPECGKFGEIAQDLDAALSALSTEAGSGEARISKEWCLKMAALEDGEIGAGMPDHPLRAAITEAGKPAPSEERLREAASIIEQFVKYLGDDPWHMVGKARDFLAGISTPATSTERGR